MTLRFLSRLYPLLFAIYPALALLAANIEEVDLGAVVRPLLLAVGLAIVILVVSRALMGGWAKAAVFASVMLLVLLSYGHLYTLLRAESGLPSSVVRHRFLAPVLAVGLAALGYALRRVRSDLRGTGRVLAVTGIVLLGFPVYAIASFTRFEESPTDEPASLLADGQRLRPPEGQPLPDIYYIILDTYTRGDTLAKEYRLDTSGFLGRLEGLGFYVAECSRANYPATSTSLTSSLNMNYFPEVIASLKLQGYPERQHWRLLQHSAVRAMLEDIGYRTIAFETGYQSSRLVDADFFLSAGSEKLKLSGLEPFDTLFLRSTAMLILFDYWRQQPSRFSQAFEQAMQAIDFPHRGFVRRELFILDTLPTLPRIPGPKFVFVHILIPHVPRVFGPDGEIVDDPRYYSGKFQDGATPEFDIRGYRNEIQFINARLVPILETILTDSETPPIIILQGDTGKGGQDLFEILNAYYTRGEDNPLLYRSITPVNTFRVVFNSYFGTDFALLEDKSFRRSEEVEERWPHCRATPSPASESMPDG